MNRKLFNWQVSICRIWSEYLHRKKIYLWSTPGIYSRTLYFFMYINDLAKITTIFFTLMFADNTSIFISGSDLYMIEKALNDEMKKEDTWLKVNRPSLNISKTHFMLFKGNTTAHYHPKISVDNKCITQVNCTIFLGIIIDSKLTWKHHIEYMSKKDCKRDRNFMETMS